MESPTLVVMIAFCLPLISIMILGEFSTARELRPADHGLQNQGFQELAPETKQFFGASTPSTESPNVALPRGMSSDNSTPWLIGGDGGGNDHLRHAMLVASLVCGVTGFN
ncbi:uncharacterized protein LOC120005904 [Tripterygium wilfordii]|uniref:uncharacterized protein LOC120005904 n=1 Tax=Tripterygium wilfordii TaxID=458696 RepID=UPI0018F83171|nr:uncharacterized protein LOC120005904 [Tripterygium wilfordii]